MSDLSSRAESLVTGLEKVADQGSLGAWAKTPNLATVIQLAHLVRDLAREIEGCPNCDGRKCMGCVFREYDHDCKYDCPLCCEVQP